MLSNLWLHFEGKNLSFAINLDLRSPAWSADFQWTTKNGFKSILWPWPLTEICLSCEANVYDDSHTAHVTFLDRALLILWQTHLPRGESGTIGH